MYVLCCGTCVRSCAGCGVLQHREGGKLQERSQYGYFRQGYVTSQPNRICLGKTAGDIMWFGDLGDTDCGMRTHQVLGGSPMTPTPLQRLFSLIRACTTLRAAATLRSGMAKGGTQTCTAL